MRCGTKSSNFLIIHIIESKLNWMSGGVTYQGAISPKVFENKCLNFQIKVWAARGHMIFFEKHLVKFLVEETNLGAWLSRDT
jgi:hypothetical protein